MEKVTMDLSFHDPSDDNMYRVAETVANGLDFLHTCNSLCDHRAELHVRVNDNKCGKGMDFFFAHPTTAPRR